MISISIPGTPIAKKRPRFSVRGGKPRTYSDQHTEEGIFLNHVRASLPPGFEPLQGPLSAEFEFWVPRPKSHFGTGRNADRLKPSAPLFPTKKPDIDNLEKFALDCLNALAFVDDQQIVQTHSCKLWSPKRLPGMTVIRLRGMDNFELRHHREFTRWVADNLESCLERNDERGKPAWETEDVSELLRHLDEEIVELRDEIDHPTQDPNRIREEATDVAATAMMIAARLDPDEPGSWTRGRRQHEHDAG